MQDENQSLRRTTTELTNALASPGNGPPANTGSMMGGTPGAQDEQNALVSSARNTLGVPYGMAPA
jgi:hypothetical protein